MHSLLGSYKYDKGTKQTLKVEYQKVTEQIMEVEYWMHAVNTAC